MSEGEIKGMLRSFFCNRALMTIGSGRMGMFVLSAVVSR